MGVLIVVSIYPIVHNLLYPGSLPITPATFLVSSLYRVGMIAIIWAMLVRDPSSVRPFPRAASQWLAEVWLALLLLGASYFLSRFAQNVAAAMGLAGGPSHWSRVHWTSPTVAWYPVETFSAAVYEELAFRAYLQTRLSEMMGGRVVVPVLTIAALFAAMHGYPALSTVGVFVSAVLFGATFMATRRLPALVLAHWAHNVLSMLAQIR